MATVSRTRSPRLLAAAVALALAGALIACSSGSGQADPNTGAAVETAARSTTYRHVVAISLDGLNPTALKRLGRKKTPVLHRLLRQGASTLNARSQIEQTVTLPNHTSMITARRIKAAAGGHGVTWNTDRPKTTIQKSSGDADVSSVFQVVHKHGGSTALFATKTKFSLFKRSWPKSVDRKVIREEDDVALVRAMRKDLVKHKRTFTFLHLGLADHVGHTKRWLSPAYLRAVRTLDRLVGRVVSTINSHKALAGSTVVVLTADHGGVPGTKNHKWRKRLADYRIPFLVWGPGVAKADLYELNTDVRKNPGKKRPMFRAKRQPIRNGEVANLSLDLLGLPAVPDSLWDAEQDLQWN